MANTMDNLVAKNVWIVSLFKRQYIMVYLHSLQQKAFNKEGTFVILNATS